jgi:alkylhydroperoxidase/carboxymuconolactone decarboxylase family protein YurZ
MVTQQKSGKKNNRRLPGHFQRTSADYPEVIKAYGDYAKAIEAAGPLSKREQRLVKLGLSFGSRSEGASHSAVRKALEAGVSPAEIEHAALLGMTTIGFPNAMACLAWVKDVVAKENGQKK